MKKRFRLALALAATAALAIPAAGGSANAAHRCGLEDVSHTLNTICDNYHNPKGLIQYVVCITIYDCPIN